MSMRIGLGLGLPCRGGVSTSAFTPASLFAPGEDGAVYDPSDLSSLWQDTAGTVPVTADGQSVARIDDKSGNGNHAIQATAGARPVYKTDGDRHWLLGDGIDDELIGGTMSVAGGASVIAAAQFIGTSTGIIMSAATSSSDTLSVGATGTGGGGFRSRVTDGAADLFRSGPWLADRFVAIARYDGAALALEVNEVAYTGTTAGQTGASLSIFAAATAPANARFFGGFAITRDLAANELTKVRDYYNAKVEP